MSKCFCPQKYLTCLKKGELKCLNPHQEGVDFQQLEDSISPTELKDINRHLKKYETILKQLNKEDEEKIIKLYLNKPEQIDT